MDIDSIIIIFGFCYVLYDLIKSIRAIKREKQKEESDNAVDDKSSEKITATRVFLEQIDDMFYLYEFQTDKFIAQGRNEKELADSIHLSPIGKQRSFFIKKQSGEEVIILEYPNYVPTMYTDMRYTQQQPRSLQ